MPVGAKPWSQSFKVVCWKWAAVQCLPLRDCDGRLGPRRVVALRALVARAGEGAFLLRVLAEHNLGRLAMRTDEATQRALKDGGARR